MYNDFHVLSAGNVKCTAMDLYMYYKESKRNAIDEKLKSVTQKRAIPTIS